MNFRFRIWRRAPGSKPSIRSWFGGLVLGSLLLPTMLYGVVAWQDRIGVLNEAEQDVQNMALIFAEHANNVFEFHKLIAGLVNEHIRGMSWSEIAESSAVHEFLAEII